jgi:uncharacterized protein involved in outer membrane biogenesis
VASPSIAWRNWLVKDAHGRATLKKGTLDVSEIAGTLFGGPFNLSGRLETGELPSLAARLKVDGADVGKALFSTGPDGLDITGGTMALSADLTARGDSPFAIVSTLAGTAELAVHEGTVKGLDLSAVSERLKHVNDPFDLLTLGSLFTTGESKFTSLRGTFKIDGGALRTEDLTLVAPSGAGSASATADLPRWSLDAKADFLLTELKDSPPVTVKFEGALDDPSAVVQADDLRQWVIRRGLGQKEKETPAPVAAVPEAAPPPQTKPPANTGQKAEAKPEGKAEAKPAASTAEKPAAASLPKADETPPEPPPPPDAKSLLKGLLDGLRP